MNLEEELKAALRREDPSPGFAERVMARAQTSAEPKAIPLFQSWRIPRMIWAAAIAAMLVIGFTGVSEYRERKAEHAAREAVMALRIAAEKLNITRDKVLGVEN